MPAYVASGPEHLRLSEAGEGGEVARRATSMGEGSRASLPPISISLDDDALDHGTLGHFDLIIPRNRKVRGERQEFH